MSHHYGRGSGGLRELALTIRPGEKVGLVGRSGAGKSTLVNLLLRFFDTEGGAIRIDGQDMRCGDAGLPAPADRHGDAGHLAAAPLGARQHPLRPARGVARRRWSRRRSRAEAHDFILGLADMNGRAGYDAHVGERGVKLSGGQRQRIALARVILKDAPILVLDEATSALDCEVEAAIQDTLYGVMQGKTVIAIAHRLSTIAHMDRIVVLDDGAHRRAGHARRAPRPRRPLRPLLGPPVRRVHRLRDRRARRRSEASAEVADAQGEIQMTRTTAIAAPRPQSATARHLASEAKSIEPDT